MKITKVYIYKQRGYHAAPSDKFIMAQAGIGMEADLEKGDLLTDTTEALKKMVEQALDKQIDEHQRAVGFTVPAVEEPMPEDLG